MITKKMSAIDHVSQVASCGAAFCSPTFHHVAKENEKVMEGRLKLCRGKYRVVYLTAPPPKISKCRPVSKFFQKKIEYPDCPPLKSLNVRLVRKIPTLRTF